MTAMGARVVAVGGAAPSQARELMERGVPFPCLLHPHHDLSRAIDLGPDSLASVAVAAHLHRLLARRPPRPSGTDQRGGRPADAGGGDHRPAGPIGLDPPRGDPRRLPAGAPRDRRAAASHPGNRQVTCSRGALGRPIAAAASCGHRTYRHPSRSDTCPRPSGNTAVSRRYAGPRPGIFAKAP
jgi:hypothetical protein